MCGSFIMTAAGPITTKCCMGVQVSLNEITFVLEIMLCSESRDKGNQSGAWVIHNGFRAVQARLIG